MADGISTENIAVAEILAAMQITLQWQQVGKEKTAKEIGAFYKIVFNAIRGAVKGE